MKQKNKHIPRISIIVPVYNSSKFIKKTVESVTNQTITTWELILIDDASTDDSSQIIANFTKKDIRIKAIHLKKNQGAGIARNIGIKNSSGRYIAFLDSDDLWHPKKLEKQLSFMINNDYPLTYTNYKKIKESGDIITQIELPNKVDYKKMLKSNYMPCLTVIYDTKYFGKQCMPEIRKRQDYGLWLELLKKVNYAYCLQEDLALYRVRRQSISSKKIDLIIHNWFLFYHVEKLGFFYSLVCLFNNILYKFIRSN